MLGYNKNIYILPFDHRSSFSQKLFAFKGKLTKAQKKLIKSYKQIIFEAFLKVYKTYKNKEDLAILIDEEYGKEIILQAQKLNIKYALTTEKSGQTQFAFEYGKNFRKHLKSFNPFFAKALVRYNPENEKINEISKKRLKLLNDFCKKQNIKFIIEPLVEPTKKQLQKFKGNKDLYDKKLRPLLTVKMIKEFHKDKIEPDIWKIEAYKQSNLWREVIKEVKQGIKRKNVALIVLGRGESKSKVYEWLKAARPYAAIKGFAIGRTVFFKREIVL